jgi:hypothetical protein
MTDRASKMPETEDILGHSERETRRLIHQATLLADAIALPAAARPLTADGSDDQRNAAPPGSVFVSGGIHTPLLGSSRVQECLRTLASRLAENRS